MAIRTNDVIHPVINKSYVKLPDGRLFNIVQVETDYLAAAKQSLRLLGVPIGTQIVLRLIPVDNPWQV